MKKRKTIQNFFAFCLLIIFSISITPKIYFHDAVANHKDAVSTCDHPQKPKACLHQKGYDCHVNDLVVTTPYLVLPVINSSIVHSYHRNANTVYISSFTQDCVIHTESRGPPQA